MGRYCYFNGSIQQEEETRLGLSDLAIRRGYAAFDFMRAEGSLPMFVTHYLARFRRASTHLHLPLADDDRRLQESLQELLTLNGYKVSGLRFILTGGYAEDAYTPTEPNFIITNDPLVFPDPVYYQQGANLMLHEFERELPEIKSINYLTPISLLPEMRKEGFYDVLYHKNGNLSEVSRSNFFVVRNGELLTPGEGILQGITRKLVIETAQKLGIKVHCGEVRLSDLWNADEAFLTSTTKRLLPVTKVQHREIGTGQTGPVWRRLFDAFQEMELNYLEQNA
jgi:branched-subunit amino acid aminotransferase/4-amino-4-deoxychorismate lyase